MLEQWLQLRAHITAAAAPSVACMGLRGDCRALMDDCYNNKRAYELQRSPPEQIAGRRILAARQARAALAKKNAEPGSHRKCVGLGQGALPIARRFG